MVNSIVRRIINRRLARKKVNKSKRANLRLTLDIFNSNPKNPHHRNTYLWTPHENTNKKRTVSRSCDRDEKRLENSF